VGSTGPPAEPKPLRLTHAHRLETLRPCVSVLGLRRTRALQRLVAASLLPRPLLAMRMLPMPPVTGCAGIARLIAAAILMALLPRIGAPPGCVVSRWLIFALRILARMILMRPSALRVLCAFAVRSTHAFRPVGPGLTIRPARGPRVGFLPLWPAVVPRPG